MNRQNIIWLSLLAATGILATTTSAVAQVTNQSDTTGYQTTSSSTITIDNLNGSGIPIITTYDPSTGIIVGGGIYDPIQFGSSGSSSSATGSGTGFGSTSGSGSGANYNSDNGATSGSGSSIGSEATDGTVPGNDSNSSSSDRQGANSTAQKKDCTASNCLSDRPQRISLNEAAELLANNLENSLENLAALENSAVDKSDRPADEPRRINRNNNTRRNASGADARRIVRQSSGCGNGCANPDLDTIQAQVDPQEVIQARQTVQQQLEASKSFIEQVNQIKPENNIW